jgi:hypothetical protein
LGSLQASGVAAFAEFKGYRINIFLTIIHGSLILHCPKFGSLRQKNKQAGAHRRAGACLIVRGEGSDHIHRNAGKSGQ